jgi:hypothetical protein
MTYQVPATTIPISMVMVLTRSRVFMQKGKCVDQAMTLVASSKLVA